MTWWFYTQQTLFHTAVDDIINCYLKEEKRERLTSFADAIWSREETWSCSLLWSALERERKIAGKEGGEEERNWNQLFFFFSPKMKSDIDEKKPEERKERRRLSGWKCDGCFVMGWHALTPASFGIMWTGQNHGQLGKTSYVVELQRSDGLKPDVFLLVFPANKSSPRWVTSRSGPQKHKRMNLNEPNLNRNSQKLDN